MNDVRALYIPSNMTKSVIFRLYEQATKKEKMRVVVDNTFGKLRQKYCPNILTMKPATDLCNQCQENVLNIAGAANANTAKLNVYRHHLKRAEVQRQYYNAWRSRAKTQSETDGKTFVVLSFDFAESVRYPRSPQQVGVSYFRTPRKCSVFGIRNERTDIQHMY